MTAAREKMEDAEKLQILLNFVGQLIKLIGVLILFLATIEVVRNPEVSSNIRVGFVVLTIFLVIAVFEQTPLVIWAL